MRESHFFPVAIALFPRDAAHARRRPAFPRRLPARRGHRASRASGAGPRPPRRPSGVAPGLSGLLGPAHSIAAAILGPEARAVGAKLFDKSPARNWALGWHQDRTIPVRERRDVPGFGRWTVKSGIPHCVPPAGILERSLTLRVHLDPAGEANSPLLVAPGSHRLGVLAEAAVPAAVERCGVRSCLAEAGDVWGYRTLVLHASERARAPVARRVLQLLYSAETLPVGLEWLVV